MRFLVSEYFKLNPFMDCSFRTAVLRYRLEKRGTSVTKVQRSNTITSVYSKRSFICTERRNCSE